MMNKKIFSLYDANIQSTQFHLSFTFQTEVIFMPYQRFRLEGADSPNVKEFPQIEAELLYITQSYYAHDWPSVLHTHHFTELFYVLSGEGYFLIEDKKLPVKADDLVIINPNVTHTEQCDTKSNLEYIVLGISGLQFDSKTDAHCDYRIHNFQSNKKEIIFILQTIIKEAQKKMTTSMRYVKICLMCF